MTVKTALHGHGTITAGMPNVFIENRALTRSRHGPFHTHMKSALITTLARATWTGIEKRWGNSFHNLKIQLAAIIQFLVVSFVSLLLLTCDKTLLNQNNAFWKYSRKYQIVC